MLENDIIISISLFIIVAVILIVVWKMTHPRRDTDKIMNAILQPHIKNEVKHIIIPDGIGGLLEVEHLILLDQGLLLIETYPMAGNLYGAETIDSWTQIIDGRSYKFDNPLRRLRTSRQAIKSLAPNIPVFCRVIFNADSVFPKGIPNEVSVLETLEEDMMFVEEEKVISAQAQQAWDTIMRIARQDGQAVTRKGGGVDG